MGKLTADGPDLADRTSAANLTAAVGAPSVSGWIGWTGDINFSISGNGVGSVVIERSFDGGATAVPVTNLGAAVTFTGPVAETLRNREAGVLHRARCTAFTSGTFAVRFSQ